MIGIAAKDIRYIAEDVRAQAKLLWELRSQQSEGSTDKTILIPINNDKVDLSKMIPIAKFNLGTNNMDVIKIPKKLEKLLK